MKYDKKSEYPIKVTSVIPEMCECGRLYKGRYDKNGKMVCPACSTGLSVEDLAKLWGNPVKNEEDLEKGENHTT